MLREYFVALLDWCKIKPFLKDERTNPSFKEGELWWCSIGMNVGVDVFGKGEKFTRPVLIFKKLDKNSFLGIPLTSQQKEGSWYVSVHYAGRNDRAMLGQARMLDSSRLTELIGTVGSENFRNIKEAFIGLYGS
jgi:mRNA interferase MazF